MPVISALFLVTLFINTSPSPAHNLWFSSPLSISKHLLHPPFGSCIKNPGALHQSEGLTRAGQFTKVLTGWNFCHRWCLWAARAGRMRWEGAGMGRSSQLKPRARSARWSWSCQQPPVHSALHQLKHARQAFLCSLWRNSCGPPLPTRNRW